MIVAAVKEPAQLLIARSRFDRIAGLLFTTFFLLSIALAAWSLSRGVAIVASVVWLSFVAIGVVANARDSGWHSYGVELAGALARNQVVAIDGAGDLAVVNVGYRLLGCNLTGTRILGGDLVAIRSSSGQASDMARRDVDDWSVFIRYRGGDRGKSLVTIGSTAPKREAEALALRLLAFFEEADIRNLRAESGVSALHENDGSGDPSFRDRLRNGAAAAGAAAGENEKCGNAETI